MEQYRIRHYYNVNQYMGVGGVTIVADMSHNAVGIALCSPKDQFSRKKGVRIAKERVERLIASTPDTAKEARLVGISAPAVSGSPQQALQSFALSVALDHVTKWFDIQGLFIYFDAKDGETADE